VFVNDDHRKRLETAEAHTEATASGQPRPGSDAAQPEPVGLDECGVPDASHMNPHDVPAPGATPPASSPSRHLLTLIVDALQLPDPADTPEDQAAYAAMSCRRASLVLHVCRRALAGPGEGAVIHAARELFDGVSATPATTYRHGRSAPRMST
jgi:hypothetical protein